MTYMFGRQGLILKVDLDLITEVSELWAHLHDNSFQLIQHLFLTFDLINRLIASSLWLPRVGRGELEPFVHPDIVSTVIWQQRVKGELLFKWCLLTLIH